MNQIHHALVMHWVSTRGVMSRYSSAPSFGDKGGSLHADQRAERAYLPGGTGHARWRVLASVLASGGLLLRREARRPTEGDHHHGRGAGAVPRRGGPARATRAPLLAPPHFAELWPGGGWWSALSLPRLGV